MASGVEGAAEFQWMDKDSADESQFQFLKEGYLNMAEVEAESEGGGKAGHGAASMLRNSDPSMKGWKRRWCILSQTADGVHLLYYNKQSSFTNCEAPCGVVLMQGCNKLYTIPNHSKSRNVFAVELSNRTIQFYTDSNSDLDPWLSVFQSALNLKDATAKVRLKGLPKQKAMRKSSGGPKIVPERMLELLSTPANPGYQEIPVPENEKLEEAAAKVQCLSFKSLSGEGVSKRKTGPPQPQLKGLPQQKALRRGTVSDKTNGVQESYSSVDVPDLDSEENPLNVKFLSFKILNT